MQSQNNVYYLRLKPARSMAAVRGRSQPSHEFLKSGFYIVAGALVGLGLANLSAVTAAILTALNVLPPQLM